jgi:hypothetical protein
VALLEEAYDVVTHKSLNGDRETRALAMLTKGGKPTADLELFKHELGVALGVREFLDAHPHLLVKPDNSLERVRAMIPEGAQNTQDAADATGLDVEDLMADLNEDPAPMASSASAGRGRGRGRGRARGRARGRGRGRG